MRSYFLALLCLLFLKEQAQSIGEALTEKQKRAIQVGDTAPNFILTVGDNSIRSFPIRRTKRITLIHFWNTDEANLKIDEGHLLHLLSHYENAIFINAAGFEIIAVAVQKDMQAWRNAIARDSMMRLTHGMAIAGLEDDVCRSYNVTQLPGDVLIDERGVIIAINPRMVDIENMLDERKNYQPLRKDLTGVLASSNNRAVVLKSCKLSLFNYYGDSLAQTSTNDRGEFSVHDIKLNQDFILKVASYAPTALYSKESEFIVEGRPTSEGSVFAITTRLANKLIVNDNMGEGKHEVEEIDVIKSLTFSDNGTRLTPKDEKELNIIVFDMKKDPLLHLDFTAHTDSRVDEVRAMELTSNQVVAIKNYFRKKGLDLCHITGIAKGSSEMRKLCLGNSDCSEEDHKLNRRVEFILYKELTE